MSAPKPKHTPTPWHINHDRNEQPNIYGPTNDDWVAVCPHQCVQQLQVIANANAEFIVRACNAHDELLEALKSASAAACDAYCEREVDEHGYAEVAHAPDCDRVRAVIAKASAR